MREKPDTDGAPQVFKQTYFHGTKAVFQLGDLVTLRDATNDAQNKASRYIFLTSTLDAAIWGAELAKGEGEERIYLVEPTGEIEDDPDLTDRKFPGNPTLSFRSIHPFRVVGELSSWVGHPEEQVLHMKKYLDSTNLKSFNE